MSICVNVYMSFCSDFSLSSLLLAYSSVNFVLFSFHKFTLPNGEMKMNNRPAFCNLVYREIYYIHFIHIYVTFSTRIYCIKTI